eukprot:2029957-Karenia_brevis.AAC.1
MLHLSAQGPSTLLPRRRVKFKFCASYSSNVAVDSHVLSPAAGATNDYDGDASVTTNTFGSGSASANDINHGISADGHGSGHIVLGHYPTLPCAPGRNTPM